MDENDQMPSVHPSRARGEKKQETNVKVKHASNPLVSRTGFMLITLLFAQFFALAFVLYHQENRTSYLINTSDQPCMTFNPDPEYSSDRFVWIETAPGQFQLVLKPFGTRENPALSCVDLKNSGRHVSGIYWISAYNNADKPFQVYCDQVTDGGGWMYIARGKSTSNQAMNDVSLDPTQTGSWHFSTEMIEDMVNRSAYDIYITHGQYSDVLPITDLNYYRIRRQNEPLTFEKPMFSYKGWSGTKWISSSVIGHEDDRGPAWGVDPANYCCKSAFGQWTECAPAPIQEAGRFSSTRMRQQLRCTQNDSSRDGLVMFIREVPGAQPYRGFRKESPGASCKDIQESTNTRTSGIYWIDANGESKPFQVYCDMTTDGGGWTYVARGKSAKKTNEEVGPLSLDPNEARVWHMSSTMISAIVGDPPYESYLTVGLDSPKVEANCIECGYYRVRLEHDNITFKRPMHKYQGWTGRIWSSVADWISGRHGHGGPTWKSDHANWCCQRESEDSHAKTFAWVDCKPGYHHNQIVDWTHQHLFCSSNTTQEQRIAMFVR